MLKTGAVSGIFRNQSVEEIINIVRDASLDAIEWDGTRHVPDGDTQKARKIRLLTEIARIETVSYVSSFKAGENNNFEQFRSILQTAKTLNAKNIRISCNYQRKYLDDSYHRRFLLESKILSDYALKEGIKISYEFETNSSVTYDDDITRFFNELNNNNLFMHYKFNEYQGTEERLRGINKLLPFIGFVKINPSLSDFQEWKKYIGLFKGADHDIYFLIDYVYDNFNQFTKGAKLLNELTYN